MFCFCGKPTFKNGKKTVSYYDNGWKNYSKQRYKCYCGNTQYETLDIENNLYNGFRISKKSVKDIIMDCHEHNKTKIAEKYNLNEKTIRNIWKKHMDNISYCECKEQLFVFKKSLFSIQHNGEFPVKIQKYIKIEKSDKYILDINHVNLITPKISVLPINIVMEENSKIIRKNLVKKLGNYSIFLDDILGKNNEIKERILSKNRKLEKYLYDLEIFGRMGKELSDSEHAFREWYNHPVKNPLKEFCKKHYHKIFNEIYGIYQFPEIELIDGSEEQNFSHNTLATRPELFIF